MQMDSFFTKKKKKKKKILEHGLYGIMGPFWSKNLRSESQKQLKSKISHSICENQEKVESAFFLNIEKLLDMGRASDLTLHPLSKIILVPPLL